MKNYNTQKIYRFLLQFILLILFIISSYYYSLSQEFKGYISVKGSIRFEKQPVKDATINIYLNDQIIDTKQTMSDGRFEYKLDFNKIYQIEVVAPELVSKKIEINTAVTDDYKEDILQYKFVFELFENISGLDISALNAPVSKVSYNEKLDKFEFDVAYDQTMKQKLQTIEAQLQSLKTKAYDETIAKADKLFDQGKYEEAIEWYDLAIDYNPSDTYPDEMIYECEDHLIETNDADAAYNRHIAAADKSFNTGKYVNAKNSYEKAAKIKPQEEYPPKRLDEINKILKQQEAAEELEDQYFDVISGADANFSQKKYALAKDSYSKALTLKPNEQYPKDKISQINTLLDEQAKAQANANAVEASYKSAITKGDAAF
ncbi:MAG: tetratricopeptide repeat protein, partial [Bacteroidia bacterium]|nr:tetratricopeptide repeat protein [Bacteroidia bacterium]